jgi:N-acetyltransferase
VSTRPPVLADQHVSLEPLDDNHRAGLTALAQDPSFWEWIPVDPSGGPFSAWFDHWYTDARAAQNDGREIVFAVRRHQDGELVGTTRYLNQAPTHRRLEIGSTYYAPEARGTRVNPACKRLLFAYAFEVKGCIRVELRCDARNHRSRRAIAGVGAQQEGTLRRHMILGDGFVRDTVCFSVVDTEWPSVSALLEARLR